MISGINDFRSVFFIGVAGTGMSAIAQYLSGLGEVTAGSDRYFKTGEYNETREKLEASAFRCLLSKGREGT